MRRQPEKTPTLLSSRAIKSSLFSRHSSASRALYQAAHRHPQKITKNMPALSGAAMAVTVSGALLTGSFLPFGDEEATTEVNTVSAAISAAEPVQPVPVPAVTPAGESSAASVRALDAQLPATKHAPTRAATKEKKKAATQIQAKTTIRASRSLSRPKVTVKKSVTATKTTKTSSQTSSGDSFTKSTKGISVATRNLNWAGLAACESSGNPKVVSANGLYYGLYQFDLRTWRSVGGAKKPTQATPAEQTYRAQLLYEENDGPSAWPVCGKRL